MQNSSIHHVDERLRRTFLSAAAALLLPSFLPSSYVLRITTTARIAYISGPYPTSLT